MSDNWCPENDGAYRAEMAAIHRHNAEDTIRILSARVAELEAEREFTSDTANLAYEAQAQGVRADGAIEQAAAQFYDAVAGRFSVAAQKGGAT